MSDRDNSKRFTLDENTPIPSAPPSHTKENTPQFDNFTSTVVLPSRGLLYDEEDPLSSGEVEIYYMTAKQEDILTNKNLLKSGKMINSLIESILVDKSIDLSTMLVGDKNAILIAARIDAYGEEYKIDFICPVCEATSKHTFNLADEVQHTDGSPTEEKRFTRLVEGDIEIKLPKCGVTVTVGMMTGKEETSVFELNKNRKKAKMDELNLVDQMNMLIKSVDGNEDPGVIAQFVERVPAADSRHFRRVYKEATPDAKLTKHFECPSCQYGTDREVAFSAEFFWPQ